MLRKYATLFFVLFAYPVFALDVGVSTGKIEVPKGLKMWGYEARTEPWIGEYDPLLIKTITFSDGKTRANLTILDLGRTPPDPELARIKAAVKDQYKVDFVMVMATHTHSGPVLAVTDIPTEWERKLSDQIIQLIGKSAEKLQPATIFSSIGKADISYDRRMVNADGSVTMFWENPEHKPNSPVDQSVRTLFFEDAKKEPLLTLVHYACHPVIGGGENRNLSPDYPGAMCAFIEKKYGGTCAFIQGACGNINPYIAHFLKKEGYEGVVKEGITVGRSVLDTRQKATAITGDLPIRFMVKTVPVPFKKNKDAQFYDLAQWMYGANFEAQVKSGKINSVTAEIPILVLGNQIAWCGFPGEFFDAFQIGLAERSPIPHTFFAGYCNGYFSYFPTIRAVAEGGYGASYGLISAPGAGERILDESIISLYEILGKL